MSVASPAKLQAAAALAEVANGIEGEVRRRFFTQHLDLRLNPAENVQACYVCYRNKTLSQPQ